MERKQRVSALHYDCPVGLLGLSLQLLLFPWAQLKSYHNAPSKKRGANCVPKNKEALTTHLEGLTKPSSCPFCPGFPEALSGPLR
jgi:hypothetical protein